MLELTFFYPMVAFRDKKSQVVAILCPLFGNIDVFPSFLILCRFKKDICVAEKGNMHVVLL